MSERVRSLAGVEFFKDLAPSDLESVSKVCHWRTFRAGQQILSHQEESSDVFFVTAGKVRAVIYSQSGKEVSFGDIDAGSTFGEIAAIDGRPRSATVVALTEAEVASMSADTFRQVLSRHPEVSSKVLAQLADLVRRLSNRVFEFSVLAVRNRIHAELLRLARRNAINTIEARISPAPTHAEIASRVATHREAVTRELNALARDGLITKKDSMLVVTDIERLAKLVEEVSGELF